MYILFKNIFCQVPSTVCLRISANSTRRVRWFTKLGMCPVSVPFTIALGSVLPSGGRISRLKLCVLRVYALLFVDKTKKEGSGTGNRCRLLIIIKLSQLQTITNLTALRSERVQKRLDSQNHIQLELIEKLYSQVSHEFDKEEEARRSKCKTIQRITDQTEASQLYDILQNANDPEAIEVIIII